MAMGNFTCRWTFYPSRLLVIRGGPTFLKLVRGAINQLLVAADLEATGKKTQRRKRKKR